MRTILPFRAMEAIWTSWSVEAMAEVRGRGCGKGNELGREDE